MKKNNNALDENISITKFYNNNKNQLNISKEKIFNWFSDNDLAYKKNGNNGYIATSNAVDNGYMKNEDIAIVNLTRLTVNLAQNGYITPNGVKYVLTKLKEEGKIKDE